MSRWARATDGLVWHAVYDEDTTLRNATAVCTKRQVRFDRLVFPLEAVTETYRTPRLCDRCSLLAAVSTARSEMADARETLNRADERGEDARAVLADHARRMRAAISILVAAADAADKVLLETAPAPQVATS